MRVVTKENNLKFLFPEVAEEWHPTKNGDLKPDQVVPGSGKRVWWRCKNGHEWRTDIYSRSNGTGCSYCLGMHPSKDYNLKLVNPELAAQWHPTKNGKLKPEHVTPGAETVAWWICERGHEWKSSIYNRKNHGCPQCALINCREKQGTISLLEHSPELAEQWHPTKNGDLTPDDVSYGSGKKIWWMCGEGHEWEREVKRRVRGIGCPYCSGHRPSKQNNLLAVNPELAKEWHPTKNGTLTPDHVTPGTERVVWWLCEKGHEWEAQVLTRNKGSICPYCLGRKRPDKSHNIHSLNSKLLGQWHPTKNGILVPNDIPYGSEQEVWWICEKSHEWQASIAERKLIPSCPFCSRHRATKAFNFEVFYPEIAKEWHPTKNGDLTPDKITPGSDYRIWWICDKGHEWDTKASARANGVNCPYCAHRKILKPKP